MTTIPDNAKTSDPAPSTAPARLRQPQVRPPRPAAQGRGPGARSDPLVDDDRYCIDVLTQIAAVTRALQEVGLGLLDVRHCVTDAARSDPAAGGERLAELTLALRRTLRL